MALRLGADLNFCRCYDSPEQTADRIGFIVGRAREAVQALEHPAFHRMIIEGLLALYLSQSGAPQASRFVNWILVAVAVVIVALRAYLRRR